MSIMTISCPHCHSQRVEKRVYKSTLHSLLKNGIFGTLTLKENALTKGSGLLESFCCTACGVVFTPPRQREQPQLICH